MYGASVLTSKKTRAVLAAVVLCVLVASVLTYNVVRRTVKNIFRLNQQLKVEGYYLADFEFKILGCAYYLDKGQYVTALSRLSDISRQFRSREGLTKVPQFDNKRQELDFYLSLQNPRTGAFMDDRYPLFTYIGPTSNVLAHIELLCGQLGEPIRLKYPLRFLDEIGTPDRLKAMLDDLSTVGLIGAKFRAPYIEATELNGYPEDMERMGLYTFTPEWKTQLLRWFYDNQDPSTGYWGPRMRGSRELLDSGDLLSTEKALKFFWRGNGFMPEFPLRYRDAMFATTLRKLSQPMPEDLDEAHEWSLVMNRGTRLLTRYLWDGASEENKALTRARIEAIVRARFQRFFVQGEGSFSLYPGAAHADLDGTGEMLGYLKEIGALSSDRQRMLWGSEKIDDLGSRDVIGAISQADFDPIRSVPAVNSLRVYRTDPAQADYHSGVLCVNYPKATPVLDLMDLLPRVCAWATTTSQSMGNWVSREDMLSMELSGVEAKPVPASTGDMPLQIVRESLGTSAQIVVVGFDALQIPRCRLTLRQRL